jgi:hypothetical protein
MGERERRENGERREERDGREVFLAADETQMERRWERRERGVLSTDYTD